jgi:hypothetical protein
LPGRIEVLVPGIVGGENQSLVAWPWQEVLPSQAFVTARSVDSFSMPSRAPLRATQVARVAMITLVSARAGNVIGAASARSVEAVIAANKVRVSMGKFSFEVGRELGSRRQDAATARLRRECRCRGTGARSGSACR